jgi:hypothetical protein
MNMNLALGQEKLNIFILLSISQMQHTVVKCDGITFVSL